MDATRTEAAQNPVYPWLMGGSLGVSVVGLYYLAGYFWGWPWGWQPAVAVWLTMFGGVPALGGLMDWLGWAGARLVDYWIRTDDDQPEDVAYTSTPEHTTPLVGGGFLTEWESYHRDGLRATFEHARAADSLASTVLIPVAFADPAQWKYWTDLAAANGLCVKANGVLTTLPAGKNYVWALRRIFAWVDVEAPDQDRPTLPPPYPFQPGLAYKAEMQKAGKGGPKVGNGLDDDD